MAGKKALGVEDTNPEKKKKGKWYSGGGTHQKITSSLRELGREKDFARFG